tara:strand:- start:2325 stop:2513 length:189 start_codon:yes stop_codon:yes gene_type:complete
MENKIMDEYIDMTPNWQGVYRWLMHMKKTNPSSYNHLVMNGDGEFEKILTLAKKKGWDKELK